MGRRRRGDPRPPCERRRSPRCRAGRRSEVRRRGRGRARHRRSARRDDLRRPSGRQGDPSGSRRTRRSSIAHATSTGGRRRRRAWDSAPVLDRRGRRPVPRRCAEDVQRCDHLVALGHLPDRVRRARRQPTERTSGVPVATGGASGDRVADARSPPWTHTTPATGNRSPRVHVDASSRVDPLDPVVRTFGSGCRRSDSVRSPIAASGPRRWSCRQARRGATRARRARQCRRCEHHDDDPAAPRDRAIAGV